MSKKLAFLLLLFAAPLVAQVSNPSVIYVVSAPSGACAAAPPLRVVISTGTTYSCNNGTWAAIGGSGSFNALTGDATSTATGGATTVVGINNTLLSGLATGLLKNTTSTGVPSIAASSDVVALFTGCSGTQYLGADGACHTASGGVSSVSGDGTLISNSASTGAVTLALGNTGAGYGVWGNTGSSSGAPGYHAMSSYPTAAFPTFNQSTTGSAASLSISGQAGLLTFTGLTSANRTKTVRDAADTILELGGSYTPTGTWTNMVFGGTVNASGATQFELPVAAGYTPAANGEVGYDSTNLNMQFWQNGAAYFLAGFPTASPPTSGDCVEFVKTTNSWKLADAGGACGTTGTGSNVNVNGGSTLSTAALTNSSGAGEIDFTNPSGSTVNAALKNTATTVNGQTCTLGSSCNVEAATSGQVAVSGGSGAALTGAADLTYSTHTFSTTANGIFDWSAGSKINLAKGVGNTAQTVASLPGSGNTTNDQRLVSDGTSLSDCTAGGGSVQHWCYWNGGAWATSIPVQSAALGGTGSSTIPTSAQIPVGNSGGTAYAPQTVGGDCTLSNSGSLTCTKTSGTAFTSYATATYVADTTFTNATTAIGGNACSTSAVTVTMTGLTTSMVLIITPSTDVSGSTGWGSSGGLVIDAWPSSTNTMSYKICNQTGSSITPAAVTWNVGAR